MAPNSLSFCLSLSNLTNYKSAAFRSLTILNSSTFSRTPNLNSSCFLTWYPVPGSHLWKNRRIVIWQLLWLVGLLFVDYINSKQVGALLNIQRTTRNYKSVDKYWDLQENGLWSLGAVCIYEVCRIMNRHTWKYPFLNKKVWRFIIRQYILLRCKMWWFINRHTSLFKNMRNPNSADLSI